MTLTPEQALREIEVELHGVCTEQLAVIRQALADKPRPAFHGIAARRREAQERVMAGGKA